MQEKYIRYNMFMSSSMAIWESSNLARITARICSMRVCPLLQCAGHTSFCMIGAGKYKVEATSYDHHMHPHATYPKANFQRYIPSLEVL